MTVAKLVFFLSSDLPRTETHMEPKQHDKPLGKHHRMGSGAT